MQTDALLTEEDKVTNQENPQIPEKTSSGTVHDSEMAAQDNVSPMSIGKKGIRKIASIVSARQMSQLANDLKMSTY